MKKKRKNKPGQGRKPDIEMHTKVMSMVLKGLSYRDIQKETGKDLKNIYLIIKRVRSRIKA